MQLVSGGGLDRVKITRLVLPHQDAITRMQPADPVDIVERNVEAFAEPVVARSLHDLDRTRLSLADSLRQRNLAPMEWTGRAAGHADALVDGDETVASVFALPVRAGGADVENVVEMRSADVEETIGGEAIRPDDPLERPLQSIVLLTTFDRRDRFFDVHAKTPQKWGMPPLAIPSYSQYALQEIGGD